MQIVAPVKGFVHDEKTRFVAEFGELGRWRDRESKKNSRDWFRHLI